MTNLDETQENKEFSPGKLLSEGRLLAGLRQEQVAKELYLTVSKVNALELDDFEHVGPDTFVRGYIRAYSNILKLDGSKVLAAYEQCTKAKQSQANTAIATPVAVNSYKKAWKFLAFIAVFFIGVWLISIWFLDKPAEKNYVLPAADAPSLAAHVDNFPATNIEPQSIQISESAASSIAPAAVQALVQPAAAQTTSATLASANAKASMSAVAAVSSSQPNAVLANTAALKSTTVVDTATKNSDSLANVKPVVAIKKNGLDEINFVFHAECWLEVSDSRGDVLATELQTAGTKLNLVGKAPFDVKLGNAPAVAIQLNGKKIDVTPVKGSNVLTLKIDE